MGSFDFNKFPQQPLYFEDNRSPEEKAASARLLNERRIVVIIQRVGAGVLVGFGLGLLVGLAF